MAGVRSRRLVAGLVAALISAPLPAQTVKAGILAWQKADYAAAVAIVAAGAARRSGCRVQPGSGLSARPRSSRWRRWQNLVPESGRCGTSRCRDNSWPAILQNGDHVAGLKWLRRAADQGEPRALLVYGTALYNGDGVSQDRVLGYAYVSRAATQGLARRRTRSPLEYVDARGRPTQGDVARPSPEPRFRELRTLRAHAS